MLKFVDSNGNPIGQKRKQSQRACLDCRQRKRRCQHPEASTADRPRAEPKTPPGNDGSRTDESPQIPPSLNLDEPVERLSSGVSHEPNEESDALDSRFIGDLNPESLLRAGSGSCASQTWPSTGNIGIWLSERLQRVKSGKDSNDLFFGFSPAVQMVLLPILKQECLGVLPPPVHLDALCSLYFEGIHPIIPVIDENTLKNLPPGSPECVVMQQALCLASSMSFSAGQHLRLLDGGPLETPQEFAKKLVGAMRASIELGLTSSTTVKIRALVLMSLFSDRTEGRELSAKLRGSAVHYVHSIGLHIQGRVGEDHERDAVSLLCCVWALDRLIAASHGRPILMHERDMGRNMQECFKKQKACFRLFLEIIAILEKVIQQYRPALDSGSSRNNIDFPAFETMVMDCNGLQISASLLATIEILYHAVAILSCRRPSSDRSENLATSSDRQAFSALRVTSVCQKDHLNELVLLPFVSYAVSLSLSVAYREMRQTKIPMYRMRAREQLRENCKILEVLGDRFWSASMMADMGNATLKEFDRVYWSLQTSRPDTTSQDAEFDLSGKTSQHNPGLSTNVEVDSLLSPPEPAEQSRSFFDASSNSFSAFSNGVTHSEVGGLNSMAELDLFEMFDPAFGLSSIDACLQGNLDLLLPFDP